MSRPINSLNKNSLVQSSSILQVITSQGPSTVTIAGGAATLSLDSLYVKNIYLLDTLHAKLNVDTNAPDKLTITKGSITNQVISDNSLNQVISFNNVKFEPDVKLSNIVSIYTDNILRLGKLGTEVDIISSNINFFSDQTMFIYTNSNIYGNLAVSENMIIGGNLLLAGLNANDILARANINAGGNITIKDNLYVGGNIINISNVQTSLNIQINFLSNITKGTIEFKPVSNIFNISHNTEIQGNLKVTGNLIIINDIINSNITIYENSNIIGNLTVENNLLVYDETKFLGNLIVNQNANIYGNLNVVGNINTSSNVVILEDLWVGHNFFLRNNLQADSAFFDKYFYTAFAEAGKLSVRGNANIGGNLLIDGNLNIFGDANIGGNLIVNQNANVYGNLTVSSNIYSFGNIIIYEDLYVGHNFFLRNNLQADSAFFDKYFYTAFAEAGKLSVNGNANIGGNLLIDGNLNIFGDANIGGNLIIGSNLQVLKDTNIGGNLIVNKDANIYGNINANNVIIRDQLILDNNTLIGNTYLRYNSNTVLSVDSSNIVNMSNIIIVDNTNLLDVLLEVRGNITCNNLYLTSNVNKKKNIREITGEEIERLNTIKSYNFDLKLNDNNNYGFLAHEIKKIYPILSNGDSVNYIGFIPLLLEKIKVLENKIRNIEQLLTT